ncbi:MAG: gamma carbonic anhydrase family protein [Sphingomonadaceae bacterium]|nr:gamma carbonic anhydrase family protein [Sphingomonadaceae bacterium]
MKDVTIVPFNGKTPRIHETAFVAPGCRLIGDVSIGAGSSLWYNCVLRADVNAIVIGERSNIQDGTVVHCDSGHGTRAGFPTLIGDDVLIGHMAMIHGCTLKDRAFVGLGTIVMDGCVIEGGGMLAAGAMLTPGKTIAAGEMWGGRPARLMKTLTEAQQASNGMGAVGYAILAQAHVKAVSEG